MSRFFLIMTAFIINEFPEYIEILNELHRMTQRLKDQMFEKIARKNNKDPSEMINFYRRIFEFAFSKKDPVFTTMILKKFPILIDIIENPSKTVLELHIDKCNLEDMVHYCTEITGYNLLDVDAVWVYQKCYTSEDRLLEYITGFIKQEPFGVNFEFAIKVAIARTGMLKDKPWYDSVVNDKLITMLKLENI